MSIFYLFTYRLFYSILLYKKRIKKGVCSIIKSVNFVYLSIIAFLFDATDFLLYEWGDTNTTMDAIKKKMQGMKLEKDNAMDRALLCEQQARDANARAEKV